AKLTGLELGRVGASVAAFNNLYLPHLHRSGFVAPSKPVSDGIESPGGYVMDSVPGLYRHILVLDFKSLYPSIIRTFLIDPKGLVEGLNLASHQQQDKAVQGFLGAWFSREQPILPRLIEHLSSAREDAKLHNNAPLSQAIKIIMNSLYGVLGSRGCVFHDARLASSITMRGHEIMKQTRLWIEAEGYEVIYGDTDSTFVWLGNDFELAQVQQTGKSLAEKVNQLWSSKLNSDFELESFLELEFETHFEQFFMPTLR
ncbi:DNA polymerase domain-containing protein, partial [Shewanella sp. 0m-11]